MCNDSPESFDEVYKWCGADPKLVEMVTGNNEDGEHDTETNDQQK
ncbi:MAG: hypothetical protein QW735_02210 [archaeon]